MRAFAAAILLALARADAAVADTRGGGIETDVDRSIDPCVDFYAYANGCWRMRTAIPPSMPMWSPLRAASETVQERLKAILEELSAARSWKQGSAEQQLGDFYGACMDEQRIEALGVEPLRPLLAEIDAAARVGDVTRLIGRFHEIGIAVPFGLTGSPDRRDPSRVIADIYFSGVGIPGEYYLSREPLLKAGLREYRAHVARLFELAGSGPREARTDAEAVLAIEKRLAGAATDLVTLRDSSATDHRFRTLEFAGLAPQFDWSWYLASSGLPPGPANVRDPAFIEEFGRALAEVKIADWRAYLRWHLLHSAAPLLSGAFVREDFAFYGRYLDGLDERPPRWKRCVGATDELLGEALGRKYVERHFPPSDRERVAELANELLLVADETIAGVEWLSRPTKASALAKLAAIVPKVGHPDVWRDGASVPISRETWWENIVAARRAAVADERAQIGRPVDRGRWVMAPTSVSAYYLPQWNEIVFPAGLLQPPIFTPGAPDAANYGALGGVIGHEISHAFDDQGGQFDARGGLWNWWAPRDAAEFQARAQCLADQFERSVVAPGLRHTGELVLGEAIADLAGVRLAYRAFQAARKNRPAPTIGGLTPDQQFFIAWAQANAEQIRPQVRGRMLRRDPHPLGEFRVNKSFSNLPEFQKAFGCAEGMPMAPRERCVIW